MIAQLGDVSKVNAAGAVVIQLRQHVATDTCCSSDIRDINDAAALLAHESRKP